MFAEVWKRGGSARRLFAAFFLLLTMCLLIWGFYISRTMQRMNSENFKLFSVLLGEVRAQYPDFEEKEWIAYLNRQGEPEAEKEAGIDGTNGAALLERYGISSKKGLSLRQETLQRQLFGSGFWLLLLLGTGSLLMLGGYLGKRQRALDGLTSYIRRVEQGDYLLEPQESREDELSRLKSELYKVTVMLKESADLSRKQKKALADSVSDISHQLKTPLTSVMVLLDNLSESEHMEEGTRKRFLSEITRQITNMNWLIAALLKLSRLDAGVVEFEWKKVAVDELLERAMENLELAAEWKQVDLERQGERGLEITGDPYWLGEALTNILKNAVEHSGPASRVEICTEETKVYTAISIRDHGEGIPPEDLKHLFERFYRGKYAKEEGVGIGLSLAREIVERQNGRLTVFSDEKGTEFVMKFIR